jgi:glycerol-3-phosphate dehydrogenase
VSRLVPRREFDVLVIGGGIVGAGAVSRLARRDADLRRLRTLLVGAADFLQPHSSAVSAACADALPEVVQ